MYTNIVIHYAEIGTKGDNRKLFEIQLMNNINRALKGKITKIYRIFGRIICDILDDKNIDSISSILKYIPGISSFSFSTKLNLDISELQKESLVLLKTKDFNSFRVNTKRSNKQFPMTSPEINIIIGKHILEKLNKKVNLDNPDMTLFIEICEKNIYLYTNKNKGVGGLPVSMSAKIICSLSGGIDSPVSSYLMMKRGCEVIFVHFFNNNLTDKPLLEKIKKLVKELTKFQLNSKLYIIPFSEVQKQIVNKVNPEYRMIIYRRFMMKIITEISKEEKIKAIVTGDSVGQVASQTIENINCIYSATKLPVLTPLIGMNKIEIIELSKFIETYNLSILQYPDCCSFMISNHPKTKSDIKKIIDIEKKIEDQEELISYCISKAKIEYFTFLET